MDTYTWDEEFVTLCLHIYDPTIGLLTCIQGGHFFLPRSNFWLQDDVCLFRLLRRRLCTERRQVDCDRLTTHRTQDLHEMMAPIRHQLSDKECMRTVATAFSFNLHHHLYYKLVTLFGFCDYCGFFYLLQTGAGMKIVW